MKKRFSDEQIISILREAEARVSARDPHKDEKRVVTPGQNEKYYLAGALHSSTGKVSYVGGNSKSSALFISQLIHLKTTYRRAKPSRSS